MSSGSSEAGPGPPSAATQTSPAEPGEEDQGSGYGNTQRNAIDQMIESTQGAPPRTNPAPANPAPRRLIGLTGGTFNGISNLSGIVTPIIIGVLAANGNFAPGMVYMTCVALVGVFA